MAQKPVSDITTSFCGVTKSVKLFFIEYDNAFSGSNGIDVLFERIDEAGGKDNACLKKVLLQLADFHARTYPNEYYNEQYIKSYAHKNITLNEINDSITQTQVSIQNKLSYDIDWDGKPECISTISSALNIVNKRFDELIESPDSFLLYRIAHVLCELVSDCAISIRCIIPLARWNIGTEDYACLSAEDQLLSLLNKAILVDRMYMSLYSLKDLVSSVNRVAQGFFILDWKIYYNIGFLNYKIHNYKDAIGYFNRIISNKELKNIDEKKLFHSYLLLAYCFEYQYKFVEAISVLACPINKIENIIDNCEYEQITKNIIELILRVSQVSDEDSLLKQWFPSKTKDMDALEAEHLEVLHALAHCINEYAISVKGSVDGIKYGKLIHFSRELMKFIANRQPEYWTCYATIHGECSDYSKAISELQNAKRKLLSKGIKKETLIAEINFFEYYFNQMIGEDVIDPKNDFKDYCIKYSDNDAECHILIFEFRNELRKYFAQLSNVICKSKSFDDLNDDNLPSIDMLYETYFNACKLSPSLYMNVSVRAELRRVERVFVCIKLFREYLVKKNEKSYSDYVRLINSFGRFFNVRFDYDLEEKCIINSNPLDYSVDHFLFDDYSGQKSIDYCLHNSDSIFILAPISGVVVYQYQTGKLNELFDNTIFSFGDSGRDIERMDYIQLKNRFIKSDKRYSIPLVKDIQWDLVSNQLTEVFCWKERLGDRIIVASRNGCHIRQLIDPSLFGKQIHLLTDNTVNGIETCDQADMSNYGESCCVFSVNTNWLEVINETGEIIQLYIFCKQGEYYIADKSKICDCHSFHRCIKNANWSFSERRVTGRTNTNRDKHELLLDEIKQAINKINEEVFAAGEDYTVRPKKEKQTQLYNLKNKLENANSISNECFLLIESYLQCFNDLDVKNLDKKLNDIFKELEH